MAGYTLDLRPIIEETLDIVLNDTDTARIRKPSETMVLRLRDMVAKMQGGNVSDDEQMETMNKLALDVLNNNIDGETYDMENIQNSLPIGAKLAIIEAYATFAVKLDQDPNLPARPSRAKSQAGPSRSTSSTRKSKTPQR